MKVVVTGGAGFIGANLCRQLGSANHNVLAFDNLSTGFRDNLHGLENVELVIGDILDFERLVEVVRGADTIVHLAARPAVSRSIADPLASHHANSTGTVHVLEAARASDVDHVIVASSSSVYGSNPTLPKHEDLKPSPVSPYAASKLATESYALAWQHSMGLKTLAFRFFNVFGPLQTAGHAYAAVIPAFVEAALAGNPLPVHGDGTQTRDFTYVGTVVSVLAVAVERQIAYPEPVNLALGTRSSLLDVIAILESIFGRSLKRDHQPRRGGDVHDSQADVARLMTLFPGLTPVPLNWGSRTPSLGFGV